MARPFPSHHLATHFSSMILAIGLFASIFAIMALCAKRHKSSKSNYESDLYEPPKSPLATPKKFIASITSNNNDIKKTREKCKSSSKGKDDQVFNGFGEGGLWQKNILMGEKCQPLEFSGVIYYDNSGNRTPEIPRSPRASAAHNNNGFQSSFSFPVTIHRS